MKKVFIYSIVLAGSVITNSYSFANCTTQPADSTRLPECIQKLSRSGSKGIRSFRGGLQYRNSFTLSSGKILYVFSSQASIGCNFNEPAGTKYYSDSCKLVASFPLNFSIKQGFKPFIAGGYTTHDFPEAGKGDYPAYFDNLAKKTEIVNAKISNPFPVERSFKIGKAEDNSLSFKTGDIIKISTKNGLQHYRNNTLVNSYKILPQLAVFPLEVNCTVPPCATHDTASVVFYLDGSKRFIDIRNAVFYVSASTYSYLNRPNVSIRVPWKKGYELKEQ